MKHLLFSLLITLFFTGCSYFNFLNPYSWFEEEKVEQKKEIVIPNDAPAWISNSEDKKNLKTVGASMRFEQDSNEFQKKRVFINASNNLLKKIYKESYDLLTEYEEEYEVTTAYHNDLKNLAKKVALRSLKKGKNTNSYLTKEKTLFMEISIEKLQIVKILQEEVKTLYKDDKYLQEFFFEKKAVNTLLNKYSL